MNFIRNVFTVVRDRAQPSLSVELWLNLLESDFSDHEIELFFGQSLITQRLKSRLPKSLRQHISLIETRLSPKLALWWALRDNQEHKEQRQLLTKAWAYPIFLLLMAFIVVLFLNHVLINQLSGFQMFGQTSPSTQLWFSLLKGMEWGYLGVLLGLICWVFMPKDLRMHWINGAGDVPIVRTWRSMSTYRLLTLFLKGLKRGLNLDDLIYALANSQTQIIRSLMKRVDENLENGISLAEAMQTIDPLLLAVFKLNDAERTVEVNLERYLRLQSLKIYHNLQRIKWGLLSLAYLSFGIIILAAYQMMFEPIRLMEGLL